MEKPGAFDKMPGTRSDKMQSTKMRLRDDMPMALQKIKEIVILDEKWRALKVRRRPEDIFEGPWMHKYQENIIFLFDRNYTCTVYAVGDDPISYFKAKGNFVNRYWLATTHHSITGW